MNYPIGYGKATVSMAELKRRYAGDMEPEFARRLFAWLASNDGSVGIGSGWRPNPHNVSRASRAGRSFHQTQTFADGSRYFCAVDLVYVNPGSKHRSIQWSEVPEQGSAEAKKVGLHCNVQRPQEPWHIQPIEIDGFTTWRDSGRQRPVENYDIPGNPRKVTQPKSIAGELGSFAPEFSTYGLYPVQPDKEELSRESSQPQDLIRYMQGVMTNQCLLNGIDIDGFFGEKTESGLASIQRWNGLEETGRCDPATWAQIDVYATF